MIKPIRKAVFPIAGLGTRFLPATKVMPKEMLTIVDKPLIQYAIDEAREAGIEEFILVTGRGKNIIEDHFDHSYELESLLSIRGRDDELEVLEKLAVKPGKLFFTRQRQPLGLGHAIWCAEKMISGEAFAILSPDDLVLSKKGCLSQMMEAYNKIGGNIVGVEEVKREHTNRYGILDVQTEDGPLVRAKGLIEKPKPDEAPSTLAIVGRYILQPEVFDYLRHHRVGAGGEIQLTDAIANTIPKIPFFGFRFAGERFDCGTKTGFVAANVAYALKRADLGANLRKQLQELITP